MTTEEITALFREELFARGHDDNDLIDKYEPWNNIQEKVEEAMLETVRQSNKACLEWLIQLLKNRDEYLRLCHQNEKTKSARHEITLAVIAIQQELLKIIK